MTDPRTCSLFLITGPSGAGKSSVVDLLLADPTLGLVRFITTTTRPMRPGEENGKDYWFVSKQEFERDLAAGKFFEWAHVYDYYYGSHIGELERLVAEGKPSLMIVDVQGAKTLRARIPESCTIFLEASRQDLIDRLEARGGEIRDVERRVKKISEEMRFRSEADIVIANPEGALNEAAEQVAHAIRTRYHQA